MSVRSPLVHPAHYFRREDRRLLGKHVVGLFLALVILEGIAILLVINWWTGEYSRIDIPFIIILLSTIFIGVFTIGWGVFAGVMHYLSGGAKPEGSHRQAFKDYLTGRDSPEGSFGQALDVTGWAFAPALLSTSLVEFPLLWYVMMQARAPTISGVMANVRELEGQLLGGAIGILEPYLNFGLAIWTVYILIYGVATTHDVSPRRAFIPAFLIFLFQVWNLVRPLYTIGRNF